MINHQVKQLAEQLAGVEAVIVGAGAGLSTSAGMGYSGRRFEEYFSDFIAKYHFPDMYSGGFYPFPSLEEQWAYWSRYIWINRYQNEIGKVYTDLLDLVKDKDYFVLTTNVDHCFQRAGFEKRRLFYTQGDFGLWQCPKPCSRKTYDNEDAVRRMVTEQENMRIPSGLIPHCPVCGRPMAMNLRSDFTFVEDEGWHDANRRYEDFLRSRDGRRILFLELGVGGNTPVIIKYPFWRMAHKNRKAVYACVNLGEAIAPHAIAERSICIDGDIGQVLAMVKEEAK